MLHLTLALHWRHVFGIGEKEINNEIFYNSLSNLILLKCFLFQCLYLFVLAEKVTNEETEWKNKPIGESKDKDATLQRRKDEVSAVHAVLLSDSLIQYFMFLFLAVYFSFY